MIVKFKKKHDAVQLPVYVTLGAAAADVFSNEETWVGVGKTRVVSTGLFPEIPDGYEIQVRPRSGFAVKHSVTVLNSPGTIDSDFRGELSVILHNFGTKPFEIKKGDRIAQLVVAPVIRATFVAVDSLTETERGEGGLGHTGK